MQRFAPSVIAALFILAVPLFLIAGSVTWAVNDGGLYRRGFDRYDISLYSGIAPADLERVGAELRRYFNSTQEPLQVRAAVFGMKRDLFNPREVAHMKDVKHLIWGTYAVAAIAALYLLAATAAGFIRQGPAFTPQLARWLLAGGLTTLGIIAAIGGFALVGFDTLFLLFHRISFANDLWQLNPRTDYLLIMFPLGFWFDATMRVALTATATALLLTATAAGYHLYHQRRPRQ